jgi:hypothetical protein
MRNWREKCKDRRKWIEFLKQVKIQQKILESFEEEEEEEEERGKKKLCEKLEREL